MTIEKLHQSVDGLRDVAHERSTPQTIAEVYDVVGPADEALRSLSALLMRASAQCANAASSPNLRVDDLGEHVEPADLARHAAEHFRVAAQKLDDSQAAVAAAHAAVGRLYVDEEKPA